MPLVKFRNRRPWGNMITSELFNPSDIFNEPLWLNKLEEPAMNIKETEDNFEIELAAPGFDKKDFEITLDNGYLNVSAEKSISKEEKEESYTRKEFDFNSFERSLKLPESVKEEEIKAKYDNGILNFKLSKKEEAKKRRPKVVEIA